MMKKIFALVLLLVLGKMSYAQYPITQTLGSDSTIVISKGALQSRLINVTYLDTFAANNQRIRQYPGAQIATTTGGLNLWIRNANATAWIPVATGSGNNIYTIDGTLLGNRTLTGAGYSLTFNQLSKLLFNADSTTVNTDQATILNNGLSTLSVKGAGARTLLIDTTAPADERIYELKSSNGEFYISILNDAQTSNDSAFLITSASRVGINTLNPDSTLKVGGGVNILGGLRVGNLPTSPGTKQLRINAQGQLSVTDTLIDAGGTVTSVGTNNGSGITGGPITTTGTLAIDTTNVIATKASVSGGLAGKLNISDTAAMLAPYLRAIDTASLSNRINLKLNISDTATMLGNYLNNVGYGLSKAGQVASADSATLSAYYLRRKDSLTATNPLGYVTKKILSDTAAAIRSSDLGGTVTSVATNNGTGITGGTITTSGTLAIDTLLVSTRAWRQKGVDSVAALANTKISGSLISGYLTKATGSLTIDTSQIYQNGQNVGIGTIVPDGRLAIVDTGGFALKINYNSASTDANNNAALYAENNGLSSYVTIFNEKTTNNTGGQFPLLVESSLTSGTAQSGMATGIHFGVPDDAGNKKVTQLALRTTDPAAATYTNRAELRLWNNGSLSTPYYLLGNGNMGLGTSTPDSNLTVVNGALFQRGVRMSGLPTGTGTKSLRVDASGTVSIADTLANGVSGSLISGYLTKATGTNTIDTSQIYQSNGRIGVSTVTPQTRLMVAETASDGALSILGNPSNVATFKFYANNGSTIQSVVNSSSSAMQIGTFVNSEMNLITNSATRVSILNNGNVGIGSGAGTDSMLTVENGARFKRGVRMSGLPTAPGTKALRINASGTISIADTLIDAGGTVTSVATNTGTGITGGTITTSGTIAADTLLLSTRAWRQKGVDSVASLINTRISGTTNYIPKFTSSSAIGNSIMYEGTSGIGIGTSSPAFKLDVIGGIRVNEDGAGTKVIQIRSDFAGVDPAINVSTNNALLLQTNNTERLRITSSGSVGIGTSTPDGIIDVTSTVAGTAYSYFQNESTTGVTSVGLAFAQSGTIKSSIQSAVYGNDYMTFNVGSNTERMRLDASGNLGLGTSNPLTRLHIQGNNTTGKGQFVISSASAGQEARMTFVDGSDDIAEISTDGNDLYFYNEQATGKFLWYTGGSLRATLDASGNLGLGVSPSAWGTNFKVFDINTLGAIWSGSGVDFASTGNAYYTATGARYKTTAAATDYWQIGGEHRWYTAPSGTAGNAISFTQAMTLDASGNLGVGVTNPAQKLHIAGTSTSAMIVGNADGSSKYYQLSYNNGQANSRSWRLGNDVISYGDFAIQQSTTQTGSTFSSLLYVGSGGNVGIGTTSPAVKLHVIGTSSNNALRLDSDASGTYTILDFANAGNVKSQIFNDLSGGDLWMRTIVSSNLIFGTNSLERMRITSGGNVLVNTTSVGSLGNGIALRGDNNGVGGYGYIQVGGTGTESRAMYIYNSNGLIGSIGTNGTGLVFASGSGDAERMRITSGGNVGIGTTSPTQKLTIGATNGYPIIDFYNSGTGFGDIGYNAGTTSFNLSSYSTTPLAFYTNGSERMRITSGGLVGIGTANPSEKFTVVTSTNYAATFNTSSIENTTTRINIGSLTTGGGGTGGSVAIGSAHYHAASAQSQMLFYTHDGTSLAERMRITSGGEVLVNTTSDAGDYKLQVNGNVYTGGELAGFIAGQTAYRTYTKSALFQISSYQSVSGSPYTKTLDIVSNADSGVESEMRLLTAASGSNPALALKLTSSQNAEFAGSIKTGAPSGGTAKPWKLGEAGVTLGGSNTSGVRVEIDGTVYYLVTGYLP